MYRAYLQERGTLNGHGAVVNQGSTNGQVSANGKVPANGLINAAGALPDELDFKAFCDRHTDIELFKFAGAGPEHAPRELVKELAGAAG